VYELGVQGQDRDPRDHCGTDDLKSLIQGRAKMEEIRQQAIKDGMTTLMQDGIRKPWSE